MRTGAPAGHAGYVHEAAVYDSDAGLLDLVVPHLETAAAASEPTFASLQDDEAALVRSAIGEPPGVTFWPPLTPYTRPAAVIKRRTSLLRDLVAGGAGQVRFVNTIPHPGLGAPWEGWCRYEAAANDLFRDLPGWGLCLYDRRITPHDVLDDVERTHPLLATVDGVHRPNDRYHEPTAFLGSRPPPPPDPLEADPPFVEMVEPVLAASRHAVQDVARRTRLARDDVDQLVVATSEAVTNAIVHGRPPVTVKMWTADERIVVTVSDRGAGPRDPYIGLVPRPSAADGGGGFGLWIAEQIAHVTYSHNDDGFTIRLVAGQALA